MQISELGLIMVRSLRSNTSRAGSALGGSMGVVSHCSSGEGTLRAGLGIRVARLPTMAEDDIGEGTAGSVEESRERAARRRRWEVRAQD